MGGHFTKENTGPAWNDVNKGDWLHPKPDLRHDGSAIHYRSKSNKKDGPQANQVSVDGREF